MISVTLFFFTDLFRQTCNNLWHDGNLFKASTWRSVWRHLFAKQGLLTSSFADWKKYFHANFHPSDHDAQLSKTWLRSHAQDLQALGPTA